MTLPTTFAIETVLGCNLRCVECAVGGGLVHRKYGMMPFSAFAGICRKISPYCRYAYLHLWGEPMLNPDIFKMIELASEFCRTNISTNGNMLDDSMAKRLIMSGGSEIIVSIDGVSQEVYETYRRRGSVEKAIHALAILVKYNRLNGMRTGIAPQFIVFEHNRHEMESFADICHRLGLSPVFKAPYLRESSSLRASDIPIYNRPRIADKESLRVRLSPYQ